MYVCMYIYMCVYIYICMYIYIYMYICTFEHRELRQPSHRVKPNILKYYNGI